jgi:hypothetical protein
MAEKEFNGMSLFHVNKITWCEEKTNDFLFQSAPGYIFK